MLKIIRNLGVATLCAGLLSSFANADQANLKQKLQNLGFEQVSISSSPLKGIKTVDTERGIFYVSDNGEYLFDGKLFHITPKGVEDVALKSLVKKLNAQKANAITYPAKNEKYVVYVFLDITCHYCHILFEQNQKYNDLGITIRYLAFPRQGLHSQNAQRMEAIWTAADPVQALNQAENDRIYPKTLKKPNIVKAQYDLGVQFGVQGTPAIITSSGEMINGYMPPERLLRALEALQNK